MRFDELIAQADAVSSKSERHEMFREFKTRLQVEKLDEEEFRRIPFGAIELDEEGRILRYNDYESKLSGIGPSYAVGKHFFTELAPCTDVKEFHGRFKDGVARKELNEQFRYHLAFKRNPIDVTITLFYSKLTNSIWVFIQPD